MKIIYNVALDEYGAECIAKYGRLASDIADPHEEASLQIWAGEGDLPQEISYWGERYPQWDAEIPISIRSGDHGGPGLDLDRSAYANALANHMRGEVIKTALRRLLRELPGEMFGRDMAPRPYFIFSGSLANPATSCLVVALMQSLAWMRAIGSLHSGNTCYYVLATGLESGSTTTDEEIHRALVAQGLHDVAAFLARSEPVADFASPVYLTGDRPIASVPPERSEQVALGAMAILGISRSVVANHQPPTRNHVDPFRFSVDADRRVELGNRTYDNTRPYGILGGYLVHCPVYRTTRLLAARVCEESLEALSGQGQVSNVKEAAALDRPPAIDALLERLESELIAEIWEKVATERKIPWDGKRRRQTRHEWFDTALVREVFKPLFDSGSWRRILSLYGESRLRSIPLEDWNGALTELEEVIEDGVIPRRQRVVAIVSGKILETLLEGLQGGLSRVLGLTFEDPVGRTPHRVAQALIGKVYSSLKRQQTEFEREQLIVRRGKQLKSPHRKVLGRLRRELSDALSAVPSPAAVLIRLVPTVLLGPVILLLLPFDLKLADPTLQRLVIGLGVGLLAGLVLYHRQVDMIRRRLLARFREWQAALQKVLSDEDQLLHDSTYAELLDVMIQTVEWVFNGHGEPPAVPNRFQTILRRHRRKAQAEEDPDLLQLQDVLARGEKHVSAAHQSFASLKRAFLEEYQASKLETILPHVSTSDQATLDREYAKLFPRGSDIAASGVLDDFLRNVHSAWEGKGSADSRMMPYRGDDDDPTRPIWRRAFSMPTGEELLDPERRQGSSAFCFMRAIQAFTRELLGETIELPARLREYLGARGKESIQETALGEKFTHLCEPSMPIDTREDFVSYVVGAGDEDLLALNLHAQNNLGASRVSAHLQIACNITADEVISYPNPDSPSTPLGRAWKAFKQEKWEHRALAPIEMESNDDRKTE